MTRLFLWLSFVGLSLAAVAPLAVADDGQDEAVLKDRQQIEGKWKIVSLVVNGNHVPPEETQKYLVRNKVDGTWSLREEGDVISQGTSTLDPTTDPKSLDFTVTKGEGEGNQHLGVYELDGNTRKMCFAPPERKRPTELNSQPGSKHICVTFERRKHR